MVERERRGADEPRSPTDHAAEPRLAGPVDGVTAWLEGKARKRRVGDLPGLLAQAVALVWRAAHWRFVLAACLQLFNAALLGVQVLVVTKAVQAILEAQGHDQPLRQVLPALLLLGAVAVAGSMGSSVSRQYERLLAEDVQKETWHGVLDVAQSVELSVFDQPRFFEHLSRVQISAIQRPLDVARSLVSLIGSIGSIAAVALALFRIHPLLPLAVALAGPPLLLLGRRGGRAEFAFVKAEGQNYRERNYLRDSLLDRELAKEVRTFGLSGFLRNRYDDRYRHYFGGLTRLVRHQIRLGLVSAGATGLVLIGTMGLLAWLVVDQRILLSQAAGAAVAVRMLSSQVEGVLSSVGRLYESSLFLQDLADFDRWQHVRGRRTDGRPPEPFTRVALDHVSMTYPGATHPALDDVSMEVSAGEIVALVGENGSGKTTLAKIVAQLYEPDSGVVLWGGRPAGSLDPVALRRQIAAIFQDFARWELTASENVGIGDTARMGMRPAVQEAGHRAGMSFVDRLPEGWDTWLTNKYQGGVDLSVGQWQRVALARAVFRGAPLVILDEPSAALDPRAEYELFAGLRTLLAGCGVLFISHRFSTVRNADRIYVLQDGQVVECGNHDELMAAGGLYAELFGLQASAYSRP